MTVDDSETVSVELSAMTVGADGDRVVRDVLGTCSVPNEIDGQNGVTGCAHSASVAGVTEVSDVGQTTTMGAEGNLVVTDGLGASLDPDDDTGQNGAAGRAHSEVVVVATEVTTAGQTLLPQLVTSPTSAQIPALTLAEIPPASPSSVRLATPTISSHSADFEDLYTDLRLRDAEMEARTAARDAARDAHFDDMLKALTVSEERIANVDTSLQSVETQGFAVKERVTEVDRNEARAIFRQTNLLSTRMRGVMTMETTAAVGADGVQAPHQVLSVRFRLRRTARRVLSTTTG